jgi:hypothetical protein
MISKKRKTIIKGAALLVVLFIVMLITICSLGFLSRSDVELATGQNMSLRIQMDYLTESGLEHAKGLILNPQDISSEYWTGATGQQLVPGNDYYDVAVVRDDSDPTNRCNYIIDCNSYRLRDGEKIGRSSIRAELRLDPCVSLWTGNDTAVWSGVTINGDIFCNGTLINDGIIDGDAFANALSGNITGRQNAVADLSLVWPRVTVADFTSNYNIQMISSSILSGQTFGPYSPVRMCYYTGNLTLAGNVQIEGMLLVDGNLMVQGSLNTITAAKNLPALLVTGSLVVESGGNLEVNGLVVINTGMQIRADAGNINILGGLFIQDALAEITADSSVNSNYGTVIGANWTSGKSGSALDFDGNDDYVKIKADPSLNNLTALTMSAWIYPRVDSHWHVIDKGDGDKRLFAEGMNRTLKGEIRYNGTHAISESINNTIILNSWQHVALTWSQTTNTIKLFHNGTEVLYSTQIAGTGGVTDDTAYPFTIGARGVLDGISLFNGIIDEVHLYNRVLDANDIPPPIDGLPGLIGHWKLDESGSSVTITAAPSKTAIFIWSATGIKEKWGQAAGAFFKSIQRQ